MKRKPRGYWTFERCQVEALKFKTRGEWKAESSSYQAALKAGWIEKCSMHMKTKKVKPRHYWDIEACKEEARRYQTLKHWSIANPTSVITARKKGWLDQCTAHMPNNGRIKRRWTKEMCLEIAKGYKTPSEWCIDSNASYRVARKRHWFDECIAHMDEPINTPKGYWTIERCKERAVKFKTRGEWHKGHIKSYRAAHRKGWLEECLP